MEGTWGEAKKDEPLPRHIREVLGKYKDVLTNELPQKFPPKRSRSQDRGDTGIPTTFQGTILIESKGVSRVEETTQ